MATVTIHSSAEQRRRRWTPSEKSRIVEDSLAPGAVVSDVARRHAVRANQVHLWRRQAREVPGVRVNFLPVVVAAERRSPGSGAIEVELLGGVRLRVDAAVDEAALGRVLRALGR